MRLEFEPNTTAFPLVENEVFEDVGPAAQSDLESLLKNGIAAAQNGERETARNLLTQVSEIDPQNEDAWMWLASISDYPEELLAFLNRVLDINPENMRASDWHAATRSLLAKTFVQRAVAAHEQGSDEHAAQCLDQALAHDYDCEMAWFWKASIATAQDQKLANLNQVLKINPDNEDAASVIATIRSVNAQAAFAEAKAAAVAGQRKKAVDILDEFLQMIPGNAEAWILRSHLSSEFREKIEALEKALAIEPENAAAKAGYDFLTATFSSATPVIETEEPEVVETQSEVEAVEPEGNFVKFAADEPEPEEEVPFNGCATEEVPVVQYLTPLAEAAPVEMFEPEAVQFDDPAPQLESVDDVQFISVEPEAVPARTVEEIFGSIEEVVDAHGETVDSFPPAAYEAATESSITFEAENHEIQSSAVDFYEIEVVSDEVAAIPFEEESTDPSVEEHTELLLAEAQGTAAICPFCVAVNDAQAFECSSCHAVLTLSDIESLLSNNRANHDVIQQAVTQMEAEWNLRDFNEKELTTLGIAHFNLHNFDSGFKYLQEASRLDSNNVILAAQVNTIAIRLEEMQRQNEVHDLMPKGKTILVVDDSPTVRKLISGKLEKSGHHVVCAVDGVDALERLEEYTPDLVLLDITMPRMDGYEVCKQIRSNPAAKDLPVVMISGKDGFFDKVRGRMAGTTGYVTKPFGPETLMKALETYLLPDEREAS